MFGTSGIRGPIGDEVTAELALRVGRAVASDVGASVDGATTPRIVVGRDPRETGEALAAALAAGCRECGADVLDLGMAATPTVARWVGWADADAGVSVTASHNPPEDNGFKLWNPSGQAFDEAQREAISRRIRGDDYDLAGWDGFGGVERVADPAARHVDALVDAIDEDLADLTVVVDVGNGAGALTATALDRLGASVRTLNAQPDGRFPGRPSEPNAENCGDLCAFVAATDADLGVAHDGDADRTMAVTETGEFVEGDALLALFARDAVVESQGDRVAVPVNTSLAVDDTLAAVGAETVRTRVGDVFVAERATEPGVAFGGEPSGAWIWPDETLCPDGPLAAVGLAALVADRGPLSALVDDVAAYPLRRESVEVADKAAAMATVAERVAADYDDASTVDGVRVETGDGWFLVRASGTQPLVRLTAEARSEERADELLAEARGLLSAALA